MTQLLQQVLDAVQQLQPTEQDAIAAMILDEIADDERWEQAFTRSQTQLSRMADKARADVAAGRFVNKGIDEL